MPARNWSMPGNSTNDSVRTTRRKWIRSRSSNGTLDSWRIDSATWKSGVRTRSSFYEWSHGLHLFEWILIFHSCLKIYASKIWFYRLSFISLQFYISVFVKHTPLPVLGNIQLWTNLFSWHKKIRRLSILLSQTNSKI